MTDSDQDAHTALAAQILDITYEEALTRKREHDIHFDQARQIAKAAHFGFVGFKEPEEFRAWARYAYGIDLSIYQIQTLRKLWEESPTRAVVERMLVSRVALTPAQERRVADIWREVWSEEEKNCDAARADLDEAIQQRETTCFRLTSQRATEQLGVDIDDKHIALARGVRFPWAV
jgi:hypothetical protein